MKSESIIIDDFYNNVDQVRNSALQSNFDIKGNFPGRRTVSYLNDSTKHAIQGAIAPHGGKVTYWGGDYTGAFQYTVETDQSWIHCDNFNSWAGVCYLTPDAPHTAGTGAFAHKETGLFRKPANTELANKLNAEGNDPSKWNMVDVMGNRYNRLVLYRGDLYHKSLDYFGTNKYNGRLFQTFFFNTEY